MKRTYLLTSSIIIALILGIASSTVMFVGSYLALIPWAIAGIMIGILSKNFKDSLFAGILYGIVLPISFFISGDKKLDFSKIYLLLLILAVIGSVCGAILVFCGNKLKSFYAK